MTVPARSNYVSRGGDKLEAALTSFAVDVAGVVCADLGSHVGGFVDCLLRRGAARIHSVDTCYGTLAWKLRQDNRVIVHERANAMHLTLTEPVGLVTIDVGWTPQSRVLPNVRRMLWPQGNVITLIKPHYEAPKSRLQDGVLPQEAAEEVVAGVEVWMRHNGWQVEQTYPSPILGHGGNREWFALLRVPGPRDRGILARG